MGVASWRFAHVKRTFRVRPVVVAIGSTVMIVIKLCKDLPQ
jgi:hypothetical protein